jgi:Predicted membrane protein (DUF2142)
VEHRDAAVRQRRRAGARGACRVGRGEITGRQDQRKDFESYVHVKLPEIYESSGRDLMCYTHRPNRDASCHNFHGSETRTKEVITEAGRHPPAYYGLVGGISRVWPSAAGEVWLMRLVTTLITALFVTMSVRALLRIPAPRIGLLALLVALTPMVLAFGGVVNPNGAFVAWLLAIDRSGATADDDLPGLRV